MVKNAMTKYARTDTQRYANGGKDNPDVEENPVIIFTVMLLLLVMIGNQIRHTTVSYALDAAIAMKTGPSSTTHRKKHTNFSLFEL